MLAALGTSPGSGAAAPLPRPGYDMSQITDTARGLLESSGLPGLSIALIDGENDPVCTALGLANRETGQPMTVSTVFQAASLTKPTFAYVVLKLCEAGRLHLDTPLMPKYLPGFAPSTGTGAEYITARMVLAHMSGLPLTHFPKWPEKMDFEPGVRFGYSGAAYIYLQKVVERVLETPLDRVMNDYLVQPLGWRKSGYLWRPEYEQQAAVAYNFDNTPVREEERSRPEQANAAGSLHATPGEYARFLAELFFRGNGVLGLDAPFKRMMLSPQIALNGHLAWGLGWALRLSDSGDRFWHWGDSRGYMSYAAGSLAQRRAVVIFTNGRNGLRVAEHLAAQIMGEDECDTFSWIYNGFYARNEAPIPPLPTDGGQSTGPAPVPPNRKRSKPGTRK